MTVNVVPEPEMLLELQSKVRYPFVSIFICPGLQTSFVPIMVKRFGAAR